MAKADTFYLTPNGDLRVSPVRMLVGEELKRSIDCNAYLGARSTTASSVTFTADAGPVDISNEALSSGVGTVEIEAISVGRGMVKMALTLANGEVLVRKFMVTATDPDFTANSDYPD